jgi:hypothetical protein
MVNFTHRKCETDGKYARDIAKKMKNRAKIARNPLYSLINKQLGTNIFKQISLDEITDFPKLKKKTIIKCITLGTFHLKISLSYISDLVKNGKAYLLEWKEFLKNNKLSMINNEESNSKIIGTEIISRHVRGKKQTNLNTTIKLSSIFKKVYRVVAYHHA